MPQLVPMQVLPEGCLTPAEKHVAVALDWEVAEYVPPTSRRIYMHGRYSKLIPKDAKFLEFSSNSKNWPILGFDFHFEMRHPIGMRRGEADKL